MFDVRSRKYRVITRLEFVNNRMTRAMLRRGWSPPWFALLETTGRRTGRKRQTPIGAGARPGEDTFWLIAAHGEQSDYLQNIKADPRVRVKLRGTWRAGTATILPDDDTVIRSKTLPYRWDAMLGRAMASAPLTVRIDFD